MVVKRSRKGDELRCTNATCGYRQPAAEPLPAAASAG
jgi:hypothetical protein